MPRTITSGRDIFAVGDHIPLADGMHEVVARIPRGDHVAYHVRRLNEVREPVPDSRAFEFPALETAGQPGKVKRLLKWLAKTLFSAAVEKLEKKKVERGW